MVQSNHIQYMIKYFIKCCNYWNHLKSIFALCNILVHVLIFHKYINQKMYFLLTIAYLVIELPYFGYNF